ncbi:DUF2712 domain-containing protein [Anoxybacillus rupiensis]|jgi:Protein of unknown function (DUF2712)|uniref:DUF2712 domain-containing protein n=1 Tax=Anoxybacteroides rupiense TaxID=311460 RepID=A0ABD5IZX6_9BACL|nr:MULTISPECIES: DUF2712 domain-containing protein [Anoxybacillus]MBB3908820.1 hypothetical protein [Anoxybacillus rupiensis]MBS2771948.1 DUF2712 domain-containing protein [Anoxybacillus rupiensis]MDE8565104.1 DUF2712 domain-containing protein [Anoxybacillus rupiensis]MED5053783.1 DUF2712 domain-containing protein [Anoxybacillus rupiensis]QHC02757.1 DUF2712 domain-containing protein [Anoxybacillus sp. PDR2]
MRNIVKKYSRLGLAAAMGVGIFTFSNFTYASDDNIGFNFELKPNYDNSYSAARYRQTTNPNNKWKVNLTYSSEGVGTVATFWLDKAGTRVSEWYNVKQGSGPHYYPAYSTANQSYVRLGAENNNYTSASYTISGYWDEETD